MSIKTFTTGRRRKTVRVPSGTLSKPVDLRLPGVSTLTRKPDCGGMTLRIASQGIRPGKVIGHNPGKPGSVNSKVRRLTLSGHVIEEDWAGALRKVPETRQTVPNRRSYPVARFLVVPRKPEQSVTDHPDPANRRPCVVINRYGQPKGDEVPHTVWEALWLGNRPRKRINIRLQVETLRMSRRKPHQLIAIPSDLPNAEQLRQLVTGVILY